MRMEMGSIKDLCVQINLYTTQRKDWSTHTNSVVEPYAVDSTVYLIGTARLIDVILDWKRGCLENSELKNIAFTAVRRPNSWISDVNWIDEMQEYTKLIARWMLPTFWGVSARWNICLYPENLPRKRPKVWIKSTRRWVKQQSPKSYFNWSAKGRFFLWGGGGCIHSGCHKTLSPTIAWHVEPHVKAKLTHLNIVTFWKTFVTRKMSTIFTF